MAKSAAQLLYGPVLVCLHSRTLFVALVGTTLSVVGDVGDGGWVW